MGQLVFQATLGGQVNLVGPNTASTYNINVPAVAGTMVTTGDTGTVSNTMIAGTIPIAKGGTNQTAFTGKSGNVAGLVFFDGTSLANDATVTDIGYDTSANKFTTGNDASISGLTVGKGAGAVSTNTAVGASALSGSVTGGYNVAVGYQSLLVNTSGIYNTAVGYQSFPANTSGQQNTGLGIQSGQANTTGGNNTALGAFSFTANTTGGSNTAIGHSALGSNTTASNNTAIGYQAGYNTTGTGNTYVGQQAGLAVTTGTYNTFVGVSTGGYGAGSYVTTGSKNTIIGGYNGNQGGLDIRTSSNVIVLSDGDGNPRFGFGYAVTGSATYSASGNYFTIGNGTTTSSTDGVVLLNGSNAANRGPAINGYANGAAVWYMGSYAWVNTGSSQFFAVSNSGGGGVYLNGSSATSWTAISDETRKIILEPITDAANKVTTLRAVIGRLKTDDETVRRPYLIAQDVQAVLPEAVAESEDKEGSVLGLSYTEVIPLLVAAFKELKVDLDATKAELATLKGQA